MSTTPRRRRLPPVPIPAHYGDARGVTELTTEDLATVARLVRSYSPGKVIKAVHAAFHATPEPQKPFGPMTKFESLIDADRARMDEEFEAWCARENARPDLSAPEKDARSRMLAHVTPPENIEHDDEPHEPSQFECLAESYLSDQRAR